MNLSPPPKSHQRHSGHSSQSSQDFIFDDSALDSLSLNETLGSSPVSRARNNLGSRGYGSHNRPLSINTVLASNQKLQTALEFEEIETHRLEKLLRDTKIKLDTTMIEQAKMEDDLDNGNKKITVLENQVKLLKKSKHVLETQYSQDQMKYINEKQQWLDAENAYHSTITRLNDRISNSTTTDGDQQYSIRSPNLSVQSFQSVFGTDPHESNTASPVSSPAVFSPVIAPVSNRQNKGAKSNDKALERAKAELELTQQQMEMVTREYTLRHEQVRQELDEIKALNTRLMEENEGFQMLLAEKTILGGFSTLADELENNSENGEEHDQNHDNSINNSSISANNSDNISIKSDILSSNTPGPESSSEPIRDTTSSADMMRRQLYDLEFENKSLKNHNRALKLSLERLVNRLLEYKEFERIVEDNQTVGQRSISNFQQRVSQEEKTSSTSTPLTIAKRRMSSISSNYRASISPVISGLGIPRLSNRVGPMKHSQTWSSILFSSSPSGNCQLSRGVNGDSRKNSESGPALLDDNLSQETTSSNSTVGVSSSASSIASDEQILDIPSGGIGLNMRRSATNGQNRLRPLRLVSPTAPGATSSSPSTKETTTPPTSAYSSWSFTFS